MAMSSNNQNELIELFQTGKINKKQIGQLRRMTLMSILQRAEIDTEFAKSILTQKKNKLDRKKIAELIGFDTKAYNITQSFACEIKQAEKGLVKQKVIIDKTNTQIRSEALSKLLAWLQERINDEKYCWPVNDKNRIYRRVLWAYFLDVDPAEVRHTGALMNEADVQKTLSELDIKIAKGQLKTLDYSATAAIEEMSDTMQSRAISALTAENKELKEKLANAREEVRNLRLDLKVYQARDLALSEGNIKGAGIH